MRAFNLGGDSAYTPSLMTATPATDVVIEPIADQVIDEGQTLRVTARVAAGEGIQRVTDFEEFTTLPASGTVLFRNPDFSGSTSVFLEDSPNVAGVTGSFPAGAGGSRAFVVRCSFVNGSNAWLRLTTFGAATLANPVIDFTKRLRIDVHADRAVRVALGLRETTNAIGTPIGSDGGTAGGIEWIGVTSRSNSQPQAVKIVPAGTWTTITFDVPGEPVTAFANGNGVLSTASGLGVLEHLVVVPADGSGTYTLHLDNLSVVDPRPVTFSLEPGAPAGSAVHPVSGEFSWTPNEAQGPSMALVTIRATDVAQPTQTDVEPFAVTVREVNQRPELAPAGSQWIHAGMTLVVTNVASDSDLPANMLSFFPAAALPAGASLDPATGELRWLAPDSLAESTNLFFVRVLDDGSPALGVTNSFTVRVTPRPSVQVLRSAGAGIALSWPAIPGRRYQVQFADDVAAAVWADLGPPVTATGENMLVNHPPGSGHRFYRLLLLD